jgi:hypothetical protein
MEGDKEYLQQDGQRIAYNLGFKQRLCTPYMRTSCGNPQNLPGNSQWNPASWKGAENAWDESGGLCMVTDQDFGGITTTSARRVFGTASAASIANNQMSENGDCDDKIPFTARSYGGLHINRAWTQNPLC